MVNGIDYNYKWSWANGDGSLNYVVGIILSNDFEDVDLFDLREVYGLALTEVDNPTIRCQLDSNQKLYILYEDISEYFGNSTTPIGAREWLATVVGKKRRDYIVDGEDDRIAWMCDRYVVEHAKRETETYMILIRCLKIICELQYVGFVKMMVEDSCDNMAFPVFDKVTIPIRDLNCDVFYDMKDNCIYDFA